MAGDWIKIECATPDKPEVITMASELGLDQDAIVGKLVRVWAWADQNSIDGNAVSVTKAFLNRYTCQPGFAEAMAKVGWLIGEDGRLCFPNFVKHNGKSSKHRLVTAQRVAAYRTLSTGVQSQTKCNADTVTSVTPTPLPKALPEKRREEKKSIPPLPPAGGQGVLIELPPAAKPPGREPDLLFEAACALLQVDYRKINGLERGKINTGLKAIRETDPAATPEDLRSRAGRYRKAYPTIKFSVVGLASHWSEFASTKPGEEAARKAVYRRQWTGELEHLLSLSATDDPEALQARQLQIDDLNRKLKSLQ